MDEMKIESKFLTGLISRYVTKTIKDKKDLDININLKSLKVKIEDGKAVLDLDANASIPQEQLTKLFK